MFQQTLDTKEEETIAVLFALGKNPSLFQQSNNKFASPQPVRFVDRTNKFVTTSNSGPANGLLGNPRGPTLQSSAFPSSTSSRNQPNDDFAERTLFNSSETNNLHHKNNNNNNHHLMTQLNNSFNGNRIHSVLNSRSVSPNSHGSSASSIDTLPSISQLFLKSPNVSPARTPPSVSPPLSPPHSALSSPSVSPQQGFRSEAVPPPFQHSLLQNSCFNSPMGYRGYQDPRGPKSSLQRPSFTWDDMALNQYSPSSAHSASTKLSNQRGSLPEYFQSSSSTSAFQSFSQPYSEPSIRKSSGVTSKKESVKQPKEKVKQSRPKLAGASAVQCIGVNRKKGIQCRNAALMEYIGPKPKYCAEHIHLDPDCLHAKCCAPPTPETKGCREIVLKEFRFCHKHIGKFVDDLITNQEYEKVRKLKQRCDTMTTQLENETNLAKKNDPDLYQRKNKILPKYYHMKQIFHQACEQVANF